MPDIEPAPCVIVLTGVLRALDPLHPADCYDVRAMAQERHGLLSRRPVRVQQQPGWRNALKVRDKPVHQLAGVRRVRNDRVNRTIMIEGKRILTGADVAGVDAAQAKGFQVPDQIAGAGTRLGKFLHAAKVRDQRHYCRPWRRVEISLATLELGSLAHITRTTLLFI
jgi:hypothetical protein